MTADEPQWEEDFRAALEHIKDTATYATRILVAQEAMGWMYRGDLEGARRAVAKLPPDQLAALSAAAAALAALADEEMIRHANP
ncbi:hypothetical protein GCM10017559_08270 [Streptosporangium longisporum]|uniref:ANTAR domain-containing protein n=1 Tax=Streptosporangium longisporum TaxID=46187 RepID=A0ABN3XTP3_9ACTN